MAWRTVPCILSFLTPLTHHFSGAGLGFFVCFLFFLIRLFENESETLCGQQTMTKPCSPPVFVQVVWVEHSYHRWFIYRLHLISCSSAGLRSGDRDHGVRKKLKYWLTGTLPKMFANLWSIPFRSWCFSVWKPRMQKYTFVMETKRWELGPLNFLLCSFLGFFNVKRKITTLKYDSESVNF